MAFTKRKALKLLSNTWISLKIVGTKFLFSVILLFLVSSANLIEEIYREQDALKKLNHKNIVGLYNAFVDKKNIVMIMEYCGGGELLETITENGALEELKCRDIVY